MKRLAIASTAAILAVGLSLSSTAHAGKCDSIGKYAKKFKQAADKICKSAGGGPTCATSGMLAKQVQSWVKWWNSMARGTWAKIGPRKLKMGRTNYGTVVAPGKRLWVSQTPASEPTVRVAVRKKGGKAGARIHLCTLDGKGRTKWIKTLDVAKGSPNKVYTLRHTGAIAGKFIAVDIIGRGKLGNGFKYDVTIKNTGRRGRR